MSSKVGGMLVIMLELAVICLLSLRTGAATVFFGYVWADTCWLLKMGQLIADSAAIPKADPFSFTLPVLAAQGVAQPFVVYQWLSELFFYWAYKCFSPVGLLAACAIVMTIAFLIIPLRCCLKVNAPALWTFLAVGAVSLTANIRCVVRPEIFSYLNLAICLALLQPLREQNELDEMAAARVNWRLIIMVALVMAIWCNLHAGFVSGLILVAIYALSFSLEDFSRKRALSGATKTLFLALIFGLFATLINPYGIGLWFYLPHLFFAPINGQIDECKPLWGLALSRAIYFLGVVALCGGAIALGIYNHSKSKQSGLESPIRQSGWLIAVIAALLGFWMRRLTPIAALIMIIETANFMRSGASPDRWPRAFLRRRGTFLMVELLALLLTIQGVSAVAGKSITVTIPSRTADFNPPFAAIQYFMQHYHDGRVLASLPISDMLDMYWGPHSALFIDSRMDAYDDRSIQDYLTMLYGKAGWQELLERYQIKWVVLSPDKALAQLLPREQGWDEVYKDETAKIFKKI